MKPKKSFPSQEAARRSGASGRSPAIRREPPTPCEPPTPGGEGWLRERLPALALRYTTVMRYKAAARKLKQITELADPTPVDVVLPAAAGEAGAASERADAVPAVEVVRARAIWEEVARGAGWSATALFARIDALTDPERVEDANMLAAWRERYANEITERTKGTWWLKRLWQGGDEVRAEVG